ncbi:MAG: SMC-Scp complex subunit ScpB [Alphaproteobacteria bacterium]
MLRIAEALLFASSEPLSDREIASRLPEGCAVDAVMADLARLYEGRGVNVVAVAGGWAFRTAGDLGYLLEKERVEPKKLSRAAMETLAIIAYHQPITRAEIEELRGVSVSKGTLDVLLDVGWARMRGRKPVPGRPITYGTTEAFLDHFGLASIMDLPGLEELKSAGLLDWRLPPDFAVPSPSQEGTVPGDGDLSEDDLSETLSEE